MKKPFSLPFTPITANSATGKDTGTKGEDPLKHRSWGDRMRHGESISQHPQLRKGVWGLEETVGVIAGLCLHRLEQRRVKWPWE